MLNKVTLVGNLGADPEIKVSDAGNAVGNLRLATSRSVKNKQTEQWEKETEWHRVVVFGKTAENVQKYKRKGDQILVEGRIQTRKWQDKEGNDRWSTEVVAERIHFLGGGATQGDHAPQAPNQSPGAGFSGHTRDAGGVDDDIPF